MNKLAIVCQLFVVFQLEFSNLFAVWRPRSSKSCHFLLHTDGLVCNKVPYKSITCYPIAGMRKKEF